MPKIKKLLNKLEKSPQNMRFSEIETILVFFEFSKRPGKGSHCRFTNGKWAIDFPVHHNDCKTEYKSNLLKFLKKHNLLHNEK